jgi:hypothetical protein
MTSITAFPQERAVNRTRSEAEPFRNDADSKPELESDDDFRHRDRVNVFAAVAVVVLVTIGVWLANALMTQKAQSCYASGTHYCSLI